MYILSIHHGHDSSVALLNDNKIIYYVQEERLNGIKHYANLPVHALDSCFKTTGIFPKDINLIVIPDIAQIPEIKRILNINESIIYNVTLKPKLKDNFLRVAINSTTLMKKINIFDKFGLPIYRDTFSFRNKTKLYQISHHLAHASSAYYTSGFDECMVVTADGAGNALSLTVWLAKKGNLVPIVEIGRGGSLGLFYNIVTEALGWQVSEGEGKVMGLAPYGSAEKTKGLLNFIAPIYRDGKLITPRNFGFPSYFKTDGLYHWHFEQSAQVKKLIDIYGRENIAAETQRVLEEQMLNFLLPLIKKHSIRKLAAAGGVFLNVKMNQKIWETNLLSDLYVYPDAGDAGLPVGAGLFAYHQIAKNTYKPLRIDNTYWGIEFSDEEIEKVLKIRNLKYAKYKNKTELVKVTAQQLSRGKIIGWFNGKLEAGPRALGNRSILMDPRNGKNKDIINARVKYREAFRPFCPSMTRVGAKRYLINPANADFMIVSYSVPQERVKDIPAVVHVDGTTRPQIVTKKSNPLYYSLISEFGNLTGVPVLLNTSFNIKGQPIVATPSDAIKCFYDTGLDYLVIGSFILQK